MKFFTKHLEPPKSTSDQSHSTSSKKSRDSSKKSKESSKKSRGSSSKEPHDSSRKPHRSSKKSEEHRGLLEAADSTETHGAWNPEEPWHPMRSTIYYRVLYEEGNTCNVSRSQDSAELELWQEREDTFRKTLTAHLKRANWDWDELPSCLDAACEALQGMRPAPHTCEIRGVDYAYEMEKVLTEIGEHGEKREKNKQPNRFDWNDLWCPERLARQYREVTSTYRY